MAVIISPRTACRYLRDVNNPKLHFNTRDGQALRNLVEMACYIKSSEEEHFKHHVSHKHNHFSNWVGSVILDKDLASQMSLVLEKKPMGLIMMKRINLLVHHATRTPRGREKARVILENARLPEEMFLTNDGREIRNLWELKSFLEAAPDHVLSYHFHGNKNDFHDWVRHILLDIELADLLLGADSRQELLQHINQRLSYLESFHPDTSADWDLEYILKRIREKPSVLYT